MARRRLGQSDWRSHSTRLGRIAARLRNIGLYAASRTLGYVVMLMTMTYSYEMFIAVIAGWLLFSEFAVGSDPAEATAIPEFSYDDQPDGDPRAGEVDEDPVEGGH